MKYLPEKESLKQHTVPEWFHDAKFGIFIHWSLSSVPAFAVTGIDLVDSMKRGIEEHFGMEGTVDIKMGTLSKTIPSVGGYVAGKKDLISFLSHASRAYIFSAALPPAQAAAANESFKVILDEPWRMEKLKANSDQFISGLKERGFDTVFYNAPHILIIHSKNQYDAMNATIALTYGMLSAQSLGLGSCWIDSLRRILNSNKDIKENLVGLNDTVWGGIIIGYPAQIFYHAPPRPSLKTNGLDELV